MRHVKKSRGLLCKTTKVKYRFIQDSPEYPVAKWVRMLEIERTGYYNWLRNHERFEKYEKNLKKEIKEEFKESRGTYGPDRIVKELRKKGKHIGRKKCAQYMEDMNLHSCHKRHKSKSLTNSKRARGDGYPNILRYYEFPISPRKGLTSDITYLKTGEGFIGEYLLIIQIIMLEILLGVFENWII